MTKSIEIIVAMSPDGDIGYKNKLPWTLRGDLKRFQELTMGNIVIMGKNTYNSLPRALDGRVVIVVSKTFAKPYVPTDLIHFVGSLPAALALAEKLPQEKVFIGGGASLYEAALQFADFVHLTTVFKKPYHGYDTRIRNFHMFDYSLHCKQQHVSERNLNTNVYEITHTYSTYRRRENVTSNDSAVHHSDGTVAVSENA